MIPVELKERVPYVSKLAKDVTFLIRPLDPYVRARIDDTVTELKGKLDANVEPEVKINWSLARYFYMQFGLAGWEWKHNGKKVSFQTKPISKWGRDYVVAHDDSLKLLQTSSLEVYNDIADAIRDNQYLREEQAKNSDSPSAASGQD